MIGTTVLKCVGENDAEFKQVKKIGASATEVTPKRAALGDLQHPGVVRGIAAKDAAQKDTKLRAVKARVDTFWKKTTSTTTTGAGTRANNATGEVAPNGVTAIRRVPTRSNSVRLGTSGTTTTGVGLGQNKVKVKTGTRANNATGEVAPNGVAALRRVPTRSNSVRLGTSGTTTTGVGLGQNKVKVKTGTRANIATGEVAPNGVAALRRVPTRSNSVRLGTSGTTTTGVGLGQNKVKVKTGTRANNATGEVAPNGVAALRRVPTRSNSVRLGTSGTTTTGVGLGQNKVKTLAAITQNAGGIPKPTLYKSNSAASTFLKKEKTAESAPLLIKKDKALTAENENKKIVTVQSHSIKPLNDVKDIDEGDSDNLYLVADYVNDIYSYLFKLEVEQPVYKNHLDDQIEVFPNMRSVIIDWINEVHTEFKLVAESFQLAVAIIDRYLQNVKDTKRSHLQLVGVTALMIATKYEQQILPAIAKFIYVTDDAYTREQIRHMEMKILKSLDYNLSRPLPIQFLRRFSKAADAEDCHRAMSKYFLELAMIEYDMSHYKPSEIAAASLYLALNLLKENTNLASGINDKYWNSTLEFYSRYSADHLRPIAKKLASIARNAPTAELKAVYIKYQASNFHKVSMRPELYSPLMDSIVNGK